MRTSELLANLGFWTVTPLAAWQLASRWHWSWLQAAGGGFAAGVAAALLISLVAGELSGPKR